MSRPLVLLFGGQSSRDPEMLARLEAVDPEAGARARERAARHGVCEPFRFETNHDVQVAVFAVTLGWLEVTRRLGLVSTASAGLSLGEYAHLVDIGALEADHALALVSRRGRLYDAGPGGCMAAIFPVGWTELGPLLDEVAREHGGPTALAPAVYNSPTQMVVAGSREAVEALIDRADHELYASGQVIEERIPMHTPRFAPVAEELRAELEAAPWSASPRLRYRPNVSVEPVPAEPATLVDRLTRHVHEPVLWRHTVDGLVADFPDAVFLETGPRTILRTLMLRRWHGERDPKAVDEPTFQGPEALERVRETLQEVRRAVA